MTSEQPPPFPNDWCYYHMRSEPFDADVDACCPECFHTFKPGELLRDWNTLAARLDLTPAATVRQVRSCPYCAHDL